MTHSPITDQQRTRRELSERHACGKPERPMSDHAVSRETLAQRVRQVGQALDARDIPAARYELRQLAREAQTLADQEHIL